MKSLTTILAIAAVIASPIALAASSQSSVPSEVPVHPNTHYYKRVTPEQLINMREKILPKKFYQYQYEYCHGNQRVSGLIKRRSLRMIKRLESLAQRAEIAQPPVFAKYQKLFESPVKCSKNK